MRGLTRRGMMLGATAVAAQALYSRSARAEDEEAEAPPEVKPLSEDHKKALDAIPFDPLPEKLVQDQSFYTSDEHTPERFYPTIKGRGGLYLGVGPEQSYLFTPWARPDIAILLDFDQTVVDLHGIYKAFFLSAADGEGLIKLWGANSKTRSFEVMEQAAASTEELERWKKAWETGQKLIFTKLKTMRTRFKSLKIPTFFNEQVEYDYLVALLKSGRVRAVRGDLTGDQAMNGVAKAARKIGVEVATQYVSNVEQYFDYDTAIDDNIVTQPVDDDSLVLRTVFKGESKFDRYHYVIQTTNDFAAWVQLPKVKKLKDIMDRAKMKKQGAAYLLPGPPGGSS